MSFDARSLERLQQLGRSLPQPLPTPQAAPPASPSPSGKPPQGKLHRIETENDPQALFRELMQVSPDGHVPPHLMERLKELERHQLQQNQQAARKPEPQAVQPGAQTAPKAKALASAKALARAKAPAKARAANRALASPIPSSQGSTATSTPPSSNCCSKTTTAKPKADPTAVNPVS